MGKFSCRSRTLIYKGSMAVAILNFPREAKNSNHWWSVFTRERVKKKIFYKIKRPY